MDINTFVTTPKTKVFQSRFGLAYFFSASLRLCAKKTVKYSRAEAQGRRERRIVLISLMSP